MKGGRGPRDPRARVPEQCLRVAHLFADVDREALEHHAAERAAARVKHGRERAHVPGEQDRVAPVRDSGRRRRRHLAGRRSRSSSSGGTSGSCGTSGTSGSCGTDGTCGTGGTGGTNTVPSTSTPTPTSTCDRRNGQHLARVDKPADPRGANEPLRGAAHGDKFTSGRARRSDPVRCARGGTHAAAAPNPIIVAVVVIIKVVVVVVIDTKH
jgi:hypothetical protein